MWMAMNNLFRTRTLASRAELGPELMGSLSRGDAPGGRRPADRGTLTTHIDAPGGGPVQLFSILTSRWKDRQEHGRTSGPGFGETSLSLWCRTAAEGGPMAEKPKPDATALKQDEDRLSHALVSRGLVT